MTMKAVCMSCSEEFEVKPFEETVEHVCPDCKIPLGIMCSVCGEGFPDEDLQIEHLDNGGLPKCPKCAHKTPFLDTLLKPKLSFADQLMSAMRPLTRQIDNLCYNNELLGEILTTLSLLQKHDLTPEILPDLVQRWNKQKRIIKED